MCCTGWPRQGGEALLHRDWIAAICHMAFLLSIGVFILCRASRDISNLLSPALFRLEPERRKERKKRGQQAIRWPPSRRVALGQPIHSRWFFLSLARVLWFRPRLVILKAIVVLFLSFSPFHSIASHCRAKIYFYFPSSLRLWLSHFYAYHYIILSLSLLKKNQNQRHLLLLLPASSWILICTRSSFFFWSVGRHPPTVWRIDWWLVAWFSSAAFCFMCICYCWRSESAGLLRLLLLSPSAVVRSALRHSMLLCFYFCNLKKQWVFFFFFFFLFLRVDVTTNVCRVALERP